MRTQGRTGQTGAGAAAHRGAHAAVAATVTTPITTTNAATVAIAGAARACPGLMAYFEYRQGALYAEEVPVADIAARFGTPCFVYCRAGLEQQYRVYEQALYKTNKPKTGKHKTDKPATTPGNATANNAAPATNNAPGEIFAV